MPKQKDVLITGKRIRLRTFCIEDASEVNQRFDSCSNVTRYTGGKKTLEETMRGLEQIIASYGEPLLGTFAAEMIATGEIAGWGILKPFLLNKTEIEIGYGVAFSMWGHGYAMEIVSLLLKYGFETVGLPKIVAAVHPDNIASKRVALKAGLTYRKKIDWPKQGRVNLYAIERACYMEPPVKIC